MKWGIDVSRWQGNFDFVKAKAEGVEFVILKAGGGDSGLYKDGKFDRNYSECMKLGLPIGVYFFGKAMSTSEALREAEYFLTLAKGRDLKMGVWYDVEAKMLNSASLSTNVLTFVQRVNAGGYNCGVYASESVFKSKLTKGFDAIPKWVARWSKTKPTIPCQIWQFGGETNLIRSNKVAGQTCDQNYLMIEESIPAPTPVPAKKSNEEIAKEVWEGKWGNGVDRRARLTANGYDYNTIQKLVNAMAQNTPSQNPIDTVEYTVKKGDTLSGIARKYKTTVNAIMALNPQIKNANKINVGWKIRVK